MFDNYSTFRLILLKVCSVLKMTLLYRKNIKIAFATVAILFFISGRSSSYAYSSSNVFLTLDHSPVNLSMGGSAAAAPNRFDNILSNPTAASVSDFSLSNRPFRLYFATQPLYLGEFRSNVLMSQFPGYNFDAAAFFQYVSTPTIDIIDDLGDKTGTAEVSFMAGGFTLSKRLMEGDSILIGGLNLKGYQSRLADYSATGVAADIGFTWFFSLPHPRSLPYIANMPNSSVSLTLRNAGSSVSFFQEAEPSPMSYELSFRKGIYSKKAHEFDYFIGFHHYLAYEYMKASTGLEYRLFSVLFFRAGYQLRGPGFSEMSETMMTFGAGLEDRKGENFSYRVDYTMARGAVDQSSHIFGAGVSYLLPVVTPTEVPRPELDMEMTAEVQRIVQDMKKKRGFAPDSIEEIYEEMRQRGYPRPKFTAGKIFYMRELEQVVYVKDGKEDDQVSVLELSDGTVIIGSILEKSDEKFHVLTSYGVIDVPQEDVRRITNKDIHNLDESIRLRIQYLVSLFKSRKERFPDNLGELREYCEENSLFMPKISNTEHKLEYNSETGEVKIIPLKLDISSETTAESNKPSPTGMDETETDAEENSEEESSSTLLPGVD